MKKNIRTLRRSLLFAFLSTGSFIFLSFSENKQEESPMIFQSSAKPTDFTSPTSYEDLIFRAWGDGDGEEDLEPGGGTDPGGGIVDPQDIPTKDSIWLTSILAFIYLFYRYLISIKIKILKFYKSKNNYINTMKTTFLLKLLVVSALLLNCVNSQAQVTIGDEVEPQSFSLLELSTANITGGLRMPQITTAQRNTLALETASLDIKTKAKGLTIYNIEGNSIEFWDGTQWLQALSGSAWNSVATLQHSNSCDQDIYQMGRIGVGTSTIDPSAIMQVEGVNKGVLFPRVALTSSTDIVTVPNPAVGLLVYNTGTGGLDVEGYLFWNGTDWVKFNTVTTGSPTITSLQCSDAKMNPTSFTAGQPYVGVLRVPYTGGNGGAYPAGLPIASTGNMGLTATLQAGSLEFGNGELTYKLTGTPSASSPVAASFNLNFLGNTCTASVSGDVLEIGGLLTFIGTIPATSAKLDTLSVLYPNQLPTMDGLRMDLIRTHDATLYRPRIFNVSSAPLNISLASFAAQVLHYRTLLNVTLPSNNSTQVDYDDAVYWGTAVAEVEIADVQVNVAPGVWRWYEMRWWCMEIIGSNQKTIFMSLQRKA